MTVSTIMGRQLPSQDPREQQLPGGNELLTRGRGQVTHPTHPPLTHPHTVAADHLTKMVAGLLIVGWA